MFIYELDGRKYLFCPKIWWDNEYQCDPDRYYKIKYDRSLRYNKVIICVSCENESCGWAKASNKIYDDLKCIRDSGRCCSCLL